jgi:hypothetical protein
VFPVRYELNFYIPEDVMLHSHRRDMLKSYIGTNILQFPVTVNVVPSSPVLVTLIM